MELHYCSSKFRLSISQVTGFGNADDQTKHPQQSQYPVQSPCERIWGLNQILLSNDIFCQYSIFIFQRQHFSYIKCTYYCVWYRKIHLRYITYSIYILSLSLWYVIHYGMKPHRSMCDGKPHLELKPSMCCLYTAQPISVSGCLG